MAEEKKDLLEKFAAASQKTSQESQQTFSVKKNTLVELPIETFPAPALQTLNPLALSRLCFKHSNKEGKFFCSVCNHWRCEDCVNIYASSVICPDSDSFCLIEEKIREQIKIEAKQSLPYKEELIQTLTFPFRQWKMILLVWLIIWVLAAVFQSATTVVAGLLPLQDVLLGAGVDFSPSILSYFVLCSIASQYLINRVQGRETLQIVNFSEFTDFVESAMLWISSATLSLFPIMYYLIYKVLQSALVMLATEISYQNNFYSIKFFLIVSFLSCWAIVFYPLSLAVIGLQRSILSVFNPKVYVLLWENYHEWLKPALIIFYSLHLLGSIFVALLWFKPYGLGLVSLSITIITIISFMAIGAAIEKGTEHKK